MLLPLRFLPATLVGALILSVFSCKQDPAPASGTAPGPAPDTIRMQPVSEVGARTFVVTGGLVDWSARSAAGTEHVGTIDVDSGSLLVNQGQVLRGHVALNMHTIAVKNMKDNGERLDLEGHLKARDFFDVAHYPQAEFTVTEVLPSKLPAFNWVLSGQLRLKNQSHPVNIPVQLTIDGDELTAESPTFQINRTQWGVNFRSGVLGTAKDKLIQDVIPLRIKLRAKAEKMD